jgi:hypothetical protein
MSCAGTKTRTRCSAFRAEERIGADSGAGFRGLRKDDQNITVGTEPNPGMPSYVVGLWEFP